MEKNGKTYTTNEIVGTVYAILANFLKGNLHPEYLLGSSCHIALSLPPTHPPTTAMNIEEIRKIELLLKIVIHNNVIRMQH